MNLTLRQLAVFASTARLHLLTKAADELHMTQSAASQSLKELESILGAPLFDRVGRNLQLNDLGKVLLPKACQMLELQTQLQQPMGEPMQGALKVAASVTIGSYLMPQLLADFVARYPLVEPQLTIENSSQVIESLNSGNIHIGLIEAPLSHKSLTISPWRKDQLAVFCANHHPLAQKIDIPLATLAEQRWILREQGSGTRSVFVLAMQQQGYRIKNSMDLSRQEAIKQTVRANLGIGVLSQLSVEKEIELGLFSRLNTPLNLDRQFSIVESAHYRDNPLASGFRNFLDTIN